MDLITLVIVILVVGFVVYLIGRAPFIDADYKTFARWAILVVFVIWLLLTLFGPLPNMRIPTRHG